MISTRRLNQQTPPQDDNAPDSIFEALRDHPLAVEDPDRVQTNTNQVTAQVDVADLLKQVTEMRAQMESLQSQNFALLTPAPQVQQVEPPKPVTFDGLPDPTLDPAGYANAVLQRVNTQQQQQQQYQASQQQVGAQREQQLNSLWEDFADQYGDIAEDTKGVEFAVRQVRENAQRRRIDIDRYMFSTPDRFIRDVANEYESIFGNREPEEEPRGPGRPRKVARKQLEDDNGGDDGRTGGIFGGSGGENAPQSGRQQTGNTDMIRDLQELQRRSGFF
jgi:hypothetical protein